MEQERVQQTLAYVAGPSALWCRQHSQVAVRVATQLARAFHWLPPELLGERLAIRLALVLNDPGRGLDALGVER